MPPFFSIIIPTYNRSTTIGPTLRSVIDQSFASFECIIVDDGSTDADALEAMVTGLMDDRFKVIRQSNGGGGAARNTGIANASGIYIAFLDSDDLFLPQKLQVVYDRIQLSEPEAIYSYARVDRGVADKMWIRPDRPIMADESMGKYLFIANQFVQTSTIVIRTDVARTIKFDPSLRKGQDLDFCLRAHSAGVRFHMIEEALIVWTDVSEAGRTSRHAGSAAPKAWLAANASILMPNEIIGYRATVLSYYQPKYYFMRVTIDILRGVIVAKVPVRVALRHWLRFMLPRRAYRSLVSIAVKSLSQKHQSRPPSP